MLHDIPTSFPVLVVILLRSKITTRLRTDSRARIHESPDLHLEKGSRLSLSCSVSDPSAPPSYVYWYRGDTVLNYSPAVTIREPAMTTTTTEQSTQGKRERKNERTGWLYT